MQYKLYKCHGFLFFQMICISENFLQLIKNYHIIVTKKKKQTFFSTQARSKIKK